MSAVLAALTDAVLRRVLAAVAPAGGRSRLSTLIFHRVLCEPDPLQPGEVTGEDFERILLWVKSLFNVIPAQEAVRGLRTGDLPSRPLVITFDDGYADNHDLAAPILLRHGLPATFFVASGYLDGGQMFNDAVAAVVRRCEEPVLDLDELALGRHPLAGMAERRRTLADLLGRVKGMPIVRRSEVVRRIGEIARVDPFENLMMTSAQVAALSRQGFEIGGHTSLHPILARLDVQAARDEIQFGRNRLEEITGRAIRFFAYPNGRPGEDFTTQTVALVRDLGFEAAFTTTPGVAAAGSDLHQLPRFTPWDRSRLTFSLRMLMNLLNRRPLTAEIGAPLHGAAVAT